MTDLKGTQTQVNLLKAFAGESQARNRYSYFASKAKKEGYVQIQSIFEETAGTIGTTIDNLKGSAAGENYEHTSMYPEFAATAREEGFEDIAQIFESIAIAELYHEQRFLALIDNIKKDQVFKKEDKVTWRCRNCGYTHEGNEAPEICPACAHGRAHFEIKPVNY